MNNKDTNLIAVADSYVSLTPYFEPTLLIKHRGNFVINPNVTSILCMLLHLNINADVDPKNLLRKFRFLKHYWTKAFNVSFWNCDKRNLSNTGLVYCEHHFFAEYCKPFASTVPLKTFHFSFPY